VKDILDLAGLGWGKLEKVLHRPLWPIHHYILEVSPDLVRGSWPDAAALAYIKEANVKNIVNLCAERKEILAYNIAILDNDHPTDAQVEDFLAIVKSGKTFVHCEEGKGRTGCMVAAYRVIVQHAEPIVALHEAVSFGMEMSNQTEWVLSLKG